MIVETALRLFRERGYDATTMRAIAAEAGVSVGNAYYYFASKEHLVQAYYDRMQQLHHEAAAPVLAGEREFTGRLTGVLVAWLDSARDYHAFAGKFFRNAAEPDSPLSPFSEESGPAREASVALFREVVEGSDLKVDPELRPDLPELLWLMHMGVVLFWVHDRSEEQAKTRLLIERAVPLVARLLGLSRLRVLRPVTRDVVALIRELSGRQAAATDGPTAKAPPK